MDDKVVFGQHVARDILDEAGDKHAEISVAPRVDVPGVRIAPPAAWSATVTWRKTDHRGVLLRKVWSDELRVASKVVGKRMSLAMGQLFLDNGSLLDDWNICARQPT
jgi:hypothetical protein